MQDAIAGSQQPPVAGYSLHEAAALLGIGVNTLRRRIATGQVRAERVQRPQGYVWRVYLDGRYPPLDPTVQPADQEATGSLPQPPTVPAQAEAMVSLIQATIGTVLGPLVAEQAALRQTTLPTPAPPGADHPRDPDGPVGDYRPAPSPRYSHRQEAAAMNETSDESRAQQAAYYAWVDEARENGRNAEPDVFRAGWEAAREYWAAEAVR